MKVRIKKLELIIAILYTFRFVLKMAVGNNGNYDLMYLFAAYASIVLFLKRGKTFLKTTCWIIPLLMIWAVTTIAGSTTVSTVKSLVFILKIMICIYLFVYVRNKNKIFDFQLFLNYSVFFLEVQTVLALLQRNSEWFWRTVENRMELLFLEPSELGIFTGLLILLQIYLIKRNGINGIKIVNTISLIIVLVLSSSMSGILYTICAISVFLVLDSGSNKGVITTKQLFFLFVAIVFISVLLSTENYISIRFYNSINGTDSSFNTRNAVPIQTLIRYIEQNGLAGFGFGNMNTTSGMDFFNLKARNYVICAAYFLFAIEGGLIAIVLEIGFSIALLRKCLRKHSAFHLALFIFMFFYMYFGGYTTNPVVWLSYALMCISEQDIYIFFSTRDYHYEYAKEIA